jgi:FG-GAP-like repeat
MIACDHIALRGLFLFLLITIANVISANAQITPITQYECDPRSTANGGTCPTGCNFTPAVEKGCNCFDSIDNDGDGKIDAADIGDCGVYFGLTFAGSGSSNCSLVPPAGNIFAGIGAPAGSQQNTADTQSKVAAGDVTGDGVPEAVITSKWNNEVRVINANGTVNASFNLSGKKSIFTGFTDVDGKTADPDRLLLEHEVLIADIKRAANLNPDGKGEIFAIVSSRGGNPKTPPNGFYLLALTWTKPDPNGLQLLYDPIPLGTNRPGIFGIADMDGDGFAELYLRDRIYAAETGKLLASEGAKTHLNTTLWDSDVSAAPAAVTVTGDNKMELICGTKVYSIPTLTNRNPAGPSSLTLVKDMNVDFPATKCFVKLMNDPTEYGIDTHSSTSVADVDADGFIDVVIAGAFNSTVGRTAVFYWNIQKNTVAYKFTPNSTELGLAAADPNFTSYATGWIWGTGRVNIGDANGDGKSDLTFIAGNQLFCLTTDGAGTGLVSLWNQNSVATATGTIGYRSINDSRSGVLTATIYDFNNDGQPEMVYRDSQSLNVIDGATGQNLLWSTICQSHTYTEGPIIADVNGDGATDICVTCNTSNSFNINADIQQQALGQVRLYFSNGNTWLPTRKVWNQPGYFVVNINDDLTLPFPQLNQNLIFSNAPCPNGIPGPQRPLNVFLNQVPYMNANGCPVFPAPDLAFIGQDPATADPNSPSYFPAVIVTPPICGNLDIGVVFNIGNTGDLPITDNVPVSFFNGDPTLPGATRLHNTTINITNLSIGDTLTTAPIIFNGPGIVFDLYILLYNDGSVLPVTLSGQTSTECEISNNLYKVTVTPSPFTAQINKFKDNLKCVALDPNSGELRARIFKGATEVFDFSPYSFQWYSGIGTTNPIPIAQGGQNAVITGLVEGDYTLVVTNTQKGCSSAPVSANIALTITIPAVTVSVLNDQTQCNPPNGKLEALVAGGNTGYTFEWFTNAVPLGVTAPVADGLKGDNYTVVVSRNGCVTSANAQVQDLAIEPDATASVLQNVVDCTIANGGSITNILSTGIFIIMWQAPVEVYYPLQMEPDQPEPGWR